MNKKVLLSVLAAGLVATTATPALATGPDTFGRFNPDGSPKNTSNVKPIEDSRNPHLPKGPITVKTEKTNKHVRVTVVDGGGRPVPGATIDFMLNGFSIGSAVTDQSGDAEAPRLFNQGEVVKFRVGTTATDFKTNFVNGEVTVGADMYTNGSVVLPYKLDDRESSTNGKTDDTASQGNKPGKVGDAVQHAKKQAQQDRANGVARKALPKTHAAK
jgi:choline binding protein J